MPASRLPRRRVERAPDAGSLVVPRRGLVALPDLPHVLTLALAVDGVLSCSSAAAAHGLPLLRPSRVVHVTVPKNRSAARLPPSTASRVWPGRQPTAHVAFPSSTRWSWWTLCLPVASTVTTWSDRRRDAALVGMGYRVLRFTWLDAVRRPAYVVAAVRAALAVSA